MAENHNFYVYMYFRPWNGQPCYVGKGIRGRWKLHLRSGVNHDNVNFARVFAKSNRLGLSVPVVKVREHLTETEALETEIALIAAIGRKCHGGPLVNLTDGGEGASGLVFTDEQLDVLRKSSAERWSKPEEHEKLRAYFAGLTDEDKTARSDKISHATQVAMSDPAVRGKISTALAGRTHDEQRRELTSKTVKAAYEKDPTIGIRAAQSRADRGNKPFAGRHHSAETKAKMSMSQLRRFARDKEESTLNG